MSIFSKIFGRNSNANIEPTTVKWSPEEPSLYPFEVMVVTGKDAFNAWKKLTAATDKNGCYVILGDRRSADLLFEVWSENNADVENILNEVDAFSFPKDLFSNFEAEWLKYADPDEPKNLKEYI